MDEDLCKNRHDLAGSFEKECFDRVVGRVVWGFATVESGDDDSLKQTLTGP